jgi:hypothetical protein
MLETDDSGSAPDRAFIRLRRIQQDYGENQRDELEASTVRPSLSQRDLDGRMDGYR